MTTLELRGGMAVHETQQPFNVIEAQKKLFDNALEGNFADFEHKESQDFANFDKMNSKCYEYHNEEKQIEEDFGKEHYISDRKEACGSPCSMSKIGEIEIDPKLSFQEHRLDTSRGFRDFKEGLKEEYSDKSFADFKADMKNSFTSSLNQSFGDLETSSNKGCDLGELTSYDVEWDSDGHPTGERWPPLGAPNDDEDNQSLYSYSEYNWQRGQSSRGGARLEDDRLLQLEEEQEQLNTSLLALTSHFAQVQFRLKQIVDASPDEKENLLHELEEFANRGIPDLREANARRKSTVSEHVDGEEDDHAGMAKQKELIEKLKQQLEDLENYAYQTGEGGPPQAKVMEKQRVVIEQLKGKLNLNVDEFDRLSVDDLKGQVDSAIRELVNPLKMKEQLVAQLQTQIVDLERFIEFLQGEGTDGVIKNGKVPCRCKTPEARHPGDGKPQESGFSQGRLGTQRCKSKSKSEEREQLRMETENIMKRATTLINMLSFGCGASSSRFQKNTLKKTPQGNHYGDMRAVLEVAINNLLDVLGPDITADSDYTSDSEETPIMISNEEVTHIVRKQLSPALRDLMQHGLMPVGQSQSLVPFLSCFPQRSHRPTKLMHAWDLILKYYQLKKGDHYNRTPARRLSQSFNLDIHGGSAVTNKQNLLGVIGNIISTHTPLKRSYDSHLKAFVCAALNQNKLITWLRLIFRTQYLVENYYQSWSYVCKTGFEDAFRSMERLNKYNFDLPVDLAVRPFQNIKDAF
ncbi:RUN domain-containing protein 1-like isoform X3 [Penaeus chinensis]|uniref:RUN domain-containing protein 1-like isoform X3 n=1 Tax=Penaeus chinensis TaxID=139456 RepID=UPI001FB757D5|nr:RUN domain-containing protein 1-like isoform X3 [Penaeus chinensis]XP_047489848.1 RUN domain-containing protein 1-like isoform X3 [Penaeus chinensis]